MRKFIVFSIIAIALLMAGCSNIVAHHYIFTGESESWTAELKVDSTEESYEEDGVTRHYNNENTRLTVTYKGELSDISSVKRIEITYETPDCIASFTKYFEHSHISKKTFTDIGGSGGDVTLIQEDTVIKMTVDIDGKIETMELKVNS